jgi:hypothetical protein
LKSLVERKEKEIKSRVEPDYLHDYELVNKFPDLMRDLKDIKKFSYVLRKQVNSVGTVKLKSPNANIGLSSPYE